MLMKIVEVLRVNAITIIFLEPAKKGMNRMVLGFMQKRVSGPVCRI